MFEYIDKPAPSWLTFFLHSLAAFLLVPILGLLNYWWTPVAGAGLALFTVREGSGRGALFAWVPGCILFFFPAWDLITGWSPAWAPMPHWEYVTNQLFGPDCSDTTCAYTLFTAIFAGGAGYSLTALFLMICRRGRRAEDCVRR